MMFRTTKVHQEKQSLVTTRFDISLLTTNCTHVLDDTIPKLDITADDHLVSSVLLQSYRDKISTHSQMKCMKLYVAMNQFENYLVKKSMLQC